jgi:hypothetical protein
MRSRVAFLTGLYNEAEWSPPILARISHKLATAASDLLVLTAFRSLGLLDVLSSTTARASVARPCQDGISTASLHKLVRNAG